MARLQRENDEQSSVKALGSYRNRILMSLAVAICLVAVTIFLWRPTWLFPLEAKLRTANQIISRVEAFRVSQGRLPETLEEVGVTDPDLRVFYEKTNNNEYVVWFGTTLGESETYNSRTKKWE